MKRRPVWRTTVALAALALTVGVAGCRGRVPAGLFRIGRAAPRVADLPRFPPPRFDLPRFDPPKFVPPANLAHLNLPNGVRGLPEPIFRNVPGMQRPFVPGQRPWGGFRPGLPGAGGPFGGPRVLIVPVPPPPRVPRVPQVPTEAAPLRLPEGPLEDTLHLASKHDWPGLSRHLTTVEQLRLPPDLQPSLTSLHNTSRELETLANLEALLAEARPNSLSRAVELAQASPALREPVRDVQRLDSLQAVLKSDWKQAPKLPALEEGLAAYGRVAGKDKALVLRGQLARAAAVRGQHALARELAPPLRDLRPQRPGGPERLGPPQADSGPNVLLPEAPPGARPGVRESALEGLADAQNEVGAAAKTARQRATASLQGQRTQYQNQVGHHLAQLTRHLHQDRDERERRKPLVGNLDQAVERALGQPLDATERILAAGMSRRGQGPAQIAASLRKLKDAK